MTTANRLLLIAIILLLAPAQRAFCASMSPAGLIQAERACRDAADPKIWKTDRLPPKCAFLRSHLAIVSENGKSYTLALQYIPDSFSDELKEAKTKPAVNTVKNNLRKKLAYLEGELSLLISETGQTNYGAFQKTLSDILKSKEFAEKKPRVVKLVPEWLRKWWEKLMSHLPKVHVFDEFPIGIAALLKALAFIFALLLVTYIIYQVVNDYRATKVPDTGIAGGEEAEDAIRTSAPQELLKAAREFAESGNYRNASRYVYISFVRAIEEAGLVAYLAVKTNREYLAELAEKKPVSANLTRMNVFYEDVWYGMRPCSPEEYEDLCGLYDTCLKEVI